MPTEGITYHSAAGRWVLAVAITGSGMAFLDSTIVNVALPAIGRDFGASTSLLQWVVSGYLLTLASLILLGGSLGDRFGRRRVFVVGAWLFSGASLLCALAPSIEFLIAARLVQGIGGALLTPGSLAMIEASFRREDRARAIGAWSGLTGVVSALGPLLGGYLIDAVSWRAAFLINLPLGLFVVLASRHVPESRDPSADGPLDARGALLGALALGAVTYALIEGPDQGLSPAIVATACIGLVALAAFLVVERRSSNPMLPLGIFASRQFTAANVVTFVVYAAMGGVFFLLVSFLQVSLHYSPVAAGAALLPQTILMLLLSARSGALAQRIGPRIPLTVGPILVAAGMLLMGLIEPGDSYTHSVLPAVIVFSLGITLVASPVTATALAAVDPSHAGVASGINNAVARVANLLAVAVLPIVAGITGDRFYDAEAMTHGFHVAMLACAGLAAAGGVIAWLTISDTALATPTDYSCPVAGPPLRTGSSQPQPAR
ncbi:MAG TPA: DHA2 family efflux MFS transporter permease subunit [Solirubrobacteraceae bacterium]|nr:DHA2 family efflux MFS transporter permease subunit [Solirubrobacteraceae bacterium]